MEECTYCYSERVCDNAGPAFASRTECLEHLCLLAMLRGTSPGSEPQGGANFTPFSTGASLT